MKVILVGSLIVIGTAVLAYFGLLAFRRYCQTHAGVTSLEAPGAVMQVIGTLYAVLLGLLVVHSLTTFDESRHEVQDETSAIALVWHTAEIFPDETRQKLQGGLFQYVIDVLEDEWKDMEVYHGVSPSVGYDLEHLWRVVKAIKPTTEMERISLERTFDAVMTIGVGRRNRLATCTNRVSPFLWIVLVAGSLAIIICSYMYGIENFAMQVCLTCLLAGILSLNLFLWAIYSYPFSGINKISSVPFELLRTDMRWYFDHFYPLDNKYLRKPGVKKERW